MSENIESVWIFTGNAVAQPSSVFQTRDQAETWIQTHKLTGMLTAYPIGVSVYDWTVKLGYFRPTKPHQSTPHFIATFSSAYLEHYHYVAGAC